MAADYIETHSGRAVHPLALEADDVTLGDIAHALGNQCRFSGHTRVFYSVAEHSVRVSLLLADWGHDVTTQLYGLLHDASEAYLQDVASPIKGTPAFERYREAERMAMKSICHKFELPYRQPTPVTYADRVLLKTEARDLMPFKREHWAGLDDVQPLAEVIVPWSPAEAKARLISRYTALQFKRLGSRANPEDIVA
jgi:5'-deoxynucleotidase YfbR-like HD superfamily hydrolase